MRSVLFLCCRTYRLKHSMPCSLQIKPRSNVDHADQNLFSSDLRYSALIRGLLILVILESGLDTHQKLRTPSPSPPVRSCRQTDLVCSTRIGSHSHLGRGGGNQSIPSTQTRRYASRFQIVHPRRCVATHRRV